MMKKEYLIAAGLAFFVLLIANLPFAVPYLIKNDDLIFLGRHAINSEDTYTYVSSIEQARQGRILFENQYTSEPQEPSLLRPSYILIGNTAKILNISSLTGYHLFRIIFSILFCIVLYKFLFLFLDSSGKRLTAFSIMLTSSGLGFALSQWFPSSIDLWIPEAITFLSLTEAPHFVLSLTLLLSGFYFFLKYLKVKDANILIFTFFAFFLLSFEHPFDLAVAVPVLILTALWNRISLPKSLGLGVASGIGLIYQVFETYRNPIMKAWQAQNLLYSPGPSSYFFGFGLILVLGIIGLEIFLKEQKPERKLILVWITVTALLLYSPVSFQRRFVEGVQIPLGIAAAFGIYKILERYKESSRKILLPLAIVILSLSSIFAVYSDFKAFATDSKDSPYYYVKPQNLTGILWLGQKTSFGDVILSNRFFGNLIPGLIGRKVYLGHQIQTIDFAGKIQKTNSFLLEKDDKKAQAFLRENRITYIFLGAGDSILQYGFRPDEKKYLTRVYENDGVSIYKVN